MYTYIDIDIYICVYTPIMYVYICIYAYICIYGYIICTYIYIYICTYVYLYRYIIHIDIHIHKNVHIHITHTYITYVHIHIHTYYIYMYTCSYTYTYTSPISSPPFLSPTPPHSSSRHLPCSIPQALFCLLSYPSLLPLPHSVCTPLCLHKWYATQIDAARLLNSTHAMHTSCL